MFTDILKSTFEMSEKQPTKQKMLKYLAVPLSGVIGSQLTETSMDSVLFCIIGNKQRCQRASELKFHFNMYPQDLTLCLDYFRSCCCYRVFLLLFRHNKIRGSSCSLEEI